MLKHVECPVPSLQGWLVASFKAVGAVETVLVGLARVRSWRPLRDPGGLWPVEAIQGLSQIFLES